VAQKNEGHGSHAQQRCHEPAKEASLELCF
jgi:hypothetical protein